MTQLIHPTAAELQSIWSSSAAEWGTVMGLEAYLKRERSMMAVPTAAHCHTSYWILASEGLPGSRQLLSTCETCCKRIVYANQEGELVDAVAHVIGSVFTFPVHRGKGYASRLMGELKERLRDYQGVRVDAATFPHTTKTWTRPVVCSILYSDVGKKFYADKGWLPYASQHISLPALDLDCDGTVKARPSASGCPADVAQTIRDRDLPSLCIRDEEILRMQLARPSRSRIRLAVVPDIDLIRWHIHRENHATLALFGRAPTVRGAVWGPAGQRVWAVWVRYYYGSVHDDDLSAANTLYILRLVIEDPCVGDARLAKGLRAILRLAKREAAEWKTASIQIWNPTEQTRRLMYMTGHEYAASIEMLNQFLLYCGMEMMGNLPLSGLITRSMRGLDIVNSCRSVKQIGRKVGRLRELDKKMHLLLQQGPASSELSQIAIDCSFVIKRLVISGPVSGFLLHNPAKSNNSFRTCTTDQPIASTQGSGSLSRP